MNTATDQLRLAVLGSPIRHSRSPLLHSTAYRALGLPWSYTAIDVTTAELETFVRSRDAHWRGLSVTMPLKEGALRLAGRLDSAALRTGAVNTLAPDPSWQTPHGFNTDVAGIVRALRAAGLDSLEEMLVIGSGATSASACAAALEMGAASVVVAARRPHKAERLRPMVVDGGARFAVTSLTDDLNDLAADAVISAVPGGAELHLGSHHELAGRSLLLDVAYDPWPSALATSWLAHGGRVLSGLAMLAHQALVQVRIFHGGSADTALPEEETVIAAMLEAVGLTPTGEPLTRV